MTAPIVRVLDGADASAYQQLRLRGLLDSPAAFSSSFEEEVGLTSNEVARRLDDQALGAVLGAFVNGVLVGITGVRRERYRKLAHRALLWGVFVAPEGRQHGVGRALGTAALSYARTTLGVRQVVLGVAAANAPAIALYTRLGFQPFGTEPEYLLVDGEYRDETHMICFLDRSAG